ncbi:MAG: glycerophosphodiester phosphodiesterase [Acidimicrobiales bacterium]
MFDATVHDNPWLSRRITAFAHQGGAWEGPSSTLWAMRRAVAAGATALELDVHATADGQLVVCHDARVDRTTNGSGAICEMTLDELTSLDNAYWFIPGSDVSPDKAEDEYPLRGRAPKDRELAIATLEEVLEAFPGLVLNLDIKATSPDVAPYEAALADLLRRYQRADDVIVASFHDAATDLFASLAPEVGISAGTRTVAEIVRAVRSGTQIPSTRHVAIQVPVSIAGVVIVDRTLVEAVHDHGMAVHVWTVNAVEEMERLVDLGIDGIISDLPSVLAGVLKAKHAAWGGLTA